MPDYGLGGDGEARLPASIADIFLALVAVVIMMLIWLAPAIRAPSMLAPAQALDIKRADIRIEGREPAVFIAERGGLRVIAPEERLVPLDALLGDAGLSQAVVTAQQAGADVLLMVEPDGQEASFLFAALASAAGATEFLQLRLDARCGFVAEAARARLCRGVAVAP